ncbi:MAG: beta-lactamase family protein, partial [Saprospiraceae bacterium]|nr:beta-lactamase family protein [Saprospiraceae bacterium]
MNRVLLGFVLAFLWLPKLESQSHIYLIDDLSAQRIVDSVTQVMADSNLVGIAVALVYDRQLVYTNSFGWEDENVSSFTAETKVRWASVSKTITGLIAAKMWEDGALDPYALVSDIVPESDVGNIRVNDLFYHQSGIEHYGGTCEDSGYMGAFNPDSTVSLVDSCSICFTPPGEVQLYSSFGSNLLGVVLDKVGLSSYGMGYYDFYLNNIRTPYGLLSLEQDSTNTDIFMSKGYSGPGSENVPEDVGWKLPSGGFMSNIVDMGRYMEIVLNYELLSQEYYDSLWTLRPIGGNPTFACDTTDSGINESFNPGFGVQWVVSDDVSINNPNFIANHSGFNQTNSRTMLHLLPNKGLGVGILCNTTSQQAGNAVRKLRNILVGILDCPGNREFISLLGMGQSTVYEASTQIDA